MQIDPDFTQFCIVINIYRLLYTKNSSCTNFYCFMIFVNIYFRRNDQIQERRYEDNIRAYSYKIHYIHHCVNLMLDKIMLLKK